MALNGWNVDNIFELTISGGSVSEDLVDFPVKITLSSGTGTASVFNSLRPTPASGISPDSYTKLLLHTKGDESIYAHTIGVNGDPSITDTAPSGFNYSFHLDGTGDYLSIPTSPSFNFGTEDFTIDWWEYRTGTGFGGIFQTTNTQYGGVTIICDTDTKLYLSSNNGSWDIANAQTFKTSVPLNEWHHYAVTRSGSAFYTYYDGAQTNTFNSSSAIADCSGQVQIGRYWTSYYSTGYISEFRVTKGVYRWASNFNPPSSPYSTTSGIDFNTMLLVHPEGDNSPNHHQIIFNESPVIDTPTGRFDSSYYFDGSADYITIPDSEDWTFGSDNFTIDFWIKRDSTYTAASQLIYVIGDWLTAATSTTYMDLSHGGNIRFGVYSGGSHTNAAITAPSDSGWHHLAGIRNGNDIQIYLDGIPGTSADVTGLSLNNSSAGITIGKISGSGNPFKGNISEFRISKGIARWTSTFKPPDSPYGSSWDNRKKIAVTTFVSGSEVQLPVEIDNWSDIDGVSADLTIPTGRARYAIQASSEYSGSYAATNAFNDTIGGNAWNSADGFPHWIGYNFLEPTAVNVLRVFNYSSPHHAEYFDIEGSNDVDNDDDWSLKSWTYITTVTGSRPYSWNVHPFENNVPYQYYRLYATHNYGFTTQWVFYEIEFKTYPNRKEATLWTKIPTVYSGSENVLYLYYDKDQTTNSGYVGDTGEVPAQDVWNSNYQVVYHFNNYAGYLMDSTGSGINATPNSTIGSDNYIRSLSGNALIFDGAEAVNFTGLTTTNFGSEATLEALVSSDSSASRALHRLGTGDGGYYPITTEGNAPYYRAYDDAFRSSRINYNLSVVTDNWHVYTIRTQPGSNGWQAYQNDTQVHQATGDASVPVNATPTIGAHTPPNSGYHLTGRVADYRISNKRHSDAWRRAVHDSYFGNFIEYSPYAAAAFTFSNPSPQHLSVTHGPTEQLQLTVSVTGPASSYKYDATFYDGSDDSQIGSTLTDRNSGSSVSTTMTTPYQSLSWYVTATSSGVSANSDTYEFSNEFLSYVDGYVMERDVPVDRVVRLYRRDTGVLMDSATSSGAGGYYYLTSTVSGVDHFVVAFDDAAGESFNALILDKITPDEVI